MQPSRRRTPLLSAANAKIAARYNLAVAAIETFHTGVSKDFLLKEEKFKDLRDRLLNSAAEFYEKLGALLKDDTDLPSRRALLKANFEVAGLANQVGRKEDALTLHLRVLAGREALAKLPGVDPSTAVDVARSLVAVGRVLEDTGKSEQALRGIRARGWHWPVPTAVRRRMRRPGWSSRMPDTRRAGSSARSATRSRPCVRWSKPATFRRLSPRRTRKTPIGKRHWPAATTTSAFC